MPRLVLTLMALGAVSYAVCPGSALATEVVTSTATVQVNSTSTSVTVNAGTAVLPSAVTCHGGQCDGLDPYAAGCAHDAVVLSRGSMVTEYGEETLAVVELDSSPSCNADWAQITVVQPFTRFAPYPVVNAFANLTDTTPDHSYTGLAINAGNSWSLMVAGHFHAQACLGETNGPNNLNCTSLS